MTLYDESAGIPLILSGPGIPRGATVTTLASLVDIHPTVLDALGISVRDQAVDGLPLQALIRGEHRDRMILSEYHDGGSPTGMFMLRTPRWKFNYYPGYPPELFDMTADPDEYQDLAACAEWAGSRQQCERWLRGLVDPEAANAQAFHDQRDLIDALGGEQAVLDSDAFDFTPVA